MGELFTRVSLDAKVHAGDRRDRRADIPIFTDMTALMSAYMERQNKSFQDYMKTRTHGTQRGP